MPSSITPTNLRNFADLPTSAVIPDQNLQVYIDMAYLVRTEDFAGSSLSVSRLDMIELNLAAHFAIQAYEKGGLTQTLVGTSEDRYRMISDKVFGIASSRFGQTALSLDTSGTLSGMASSPLKALFRVVGDPPSTGWEE